MPLKSHILSADSNISHGFCTKSKVDELNERLFYLKQIHSNNVVILDKGFAPSDFNNIAGDAIITGEVNVTIGVLTADCVPVLFYDPQAFVIGTIHCGWKGILAGIVPKTLSKAISEFGCSYENIKLAIGPSIEKKCYEVSEDLITTFDEVFGNECKKFQDNKDGKWFLDLKSYVTQSLLDLGIPDNNIASINLCTFCEKDQFHSYRRDGKTGKHNLNWIMMTA